MCYVLSMNAAAAAEVLPAEPPSAPVPARSKTMTLEEWANMAEDEPGEFVNGELVEEEVPSILHEIIVRWLIRTLDVWAAPRDYPVFGSELKIRVSRGVGRKPDVSMYAQGTRLRGNAAIARKPPLLIVEVLSPQTRDVKRDRLEKRLEYAKFGVQHYWLVDPEARIFEFLSIGSNGRWVDAVESASEGQVKIPAFEDLILDLDELWAEVDSIVEDGESDEKIESDDG